MRPARKVKATVALRGGLDHLSRTHLSPRSEEAAHAVTSVHPANSCGSSDVLPAGDLPVPAPVLSMYPRSPGLTPIPVLSSLGRPQRPIMWSLCVRQCAKRSLEFSH